MTDTTQAPQRTKKGLAFETAADLADLFYELSHNPKTRKDIARAVKAAKPDSPHAAAFSDVDVEDKFDTFKREQEEREIAAQQKAVIARMNAQRSRLLTGAEDGGRKWSEDEVKKIEDLMQKKGLVDYDDGATLYAATLPPDNPQPHRDDPAPHGATWEFPEWATFGKEPDKAARNIAHQVITEFRRKH